MRPFTTGELARFRSAQDSAMQDTCRVLVYSSTQDDHGNPVALYTAGAALDCGVEWVTPKEAHGTGEVPLIDARIRLPIGTALVPADRIRVTHRYAEDVTDVDLEQVSYPKRGPSGLYCDCKRVNDV